MKDYFLEFQQELESFINNFIFRIKRASKILDYDLSPIIANALYSAISRKHVQYDWLRKNGHTKHSAITLLCQALTDFIPTRGDSPNHLIRPLPHIAFTAEHHNKPLLFIYNPRQLSYWEPIITQLKDSAIFLVMFPARRCEGFRLKNVFEFPLFNIQNITTGFLSQKTPGILRLLLGFDLIVSSLKPSKIVCMEGCHIEEKTLAMVGHHYNIQSICVQQGWPSVFHSGFKKLPFDYMLSWGGIFNSYWRKYNPGMNCVSVGYIYSIPNKIAPHDCITFFLQGPFIISCPEYIDLFLQLIEDCALSFKEYTILVREHPEYRISEDLHRRMAAYDNIDFVTERPLSDVFMRTSICVSHFSSTIVESTIYGCVPVVFDPTTDSRYIPDLDLLQIGHFSKTCEDVIATISSFLNMRKQNTGKIITTTGIKAVHNVIEFLNQK